MTIWFTSDTHFYHQKVLKYASRPFSSLDEMHEVLIQNWNSCVRKGDAVYVIGDFSLGTQEQSKTILDRLAGQKFLVIGNHDRKRGELLNRCFGWTRDMYELKVNDATSSTAYGGKQKIVLCHFPLLVWNAANHGSWSLHGHSHGSLPESPTARRIDVGVDCNNYKPISYEEVRERMSTKTFAPMDYHKEREKTTE